MTLTLELPAEIEQALTARAQARGVTLPKYLLDLAERDAQVSPQDFSPAAVATHGKMATMLASLGRYNTRAGSGLEPSPQDDVASLYAEREDAQK